ncbi:hypothetical protein LCGC14_1471440 [marine sediment metagenome]|uniref:Uncharacterized protein n=1 Tax=marine sediment metagenome TaxID=412755 RepID=A0A0F9LSQ2_9ZZZZ
MNTKQAIAAFSDGRYKHDAYHIRVVTQSGCEYAVSLDVIEVATDDLREYDGYVYGTRINGTRGGPFHRRTQGELRWFMLSNVKLQEEHNVN